MRLQIQRKDGKVVAELLALPGAPLRLVQATSPAVAVDIERWLVNGIVEMVGLPGERHQKRIAPGDLTFLRAVLAHVRRLGFVPVLGATTTKYVRVTAPPADASPRLIQRRPPPGPVRRLTVAAAAATALVIVSTSQGKVATTETSVGPGVTVADVEVQSVNTDLGDADRVEG